MVATATAALETDKRVRYRYICSTIEADCDLLLFLEIWKVTDTTTKQAAQGMIVN